MRIPKLLTFDIFGTVLDWRTGLTQAVQAQTGGIEAQQFERVIDYQAQEEAKLYRSYREITALSLVNVLGLSPELAREIGARVGEWPLFPDVREGMKRLISIAPCVAMTNSDEVHGEQVQKQLGFPLSAWICAEETRCYKPSPLFWKAAANRLGVTFDKDWWHVSAYADYDFMSQASWD